MRSLLGSDTLLLNNQTRIFVSRDLGQTWSLSYTSPGTSTACELDAVAPFAPILNGEKVIVPFNLGCFLMFDITTSKWEQLQLPGLSLFAPLWTFIDSETRNFGFLSQTDLVVFDHQDGALVSSGTAAADWNLGGSLTLNAYTMFQDHLWIYGSGGAIFKSV